MILLSPPKAGGGDKDQQCDATLSSLFSTLALVGSCSLRTPSPPPPKEETNSPDFPEKIDIGGKKEKEPTKVLSRFFLGTLRKKKEQRLSINAGRRTSFGLFFFRHPTP